MITIYQCVKWALHYRVGLYPAPGPATGQAERPAGVRPGRKGGSMLGVGHEGCITTTPGGTPLKPLRHVCFLRNTCSASKVGGTLNFGFLLLGFFHLAYLY